MKSSAIDPNKIHEYSLEILLQTGFQIEDETIHDRLLERGVACDRKTGVIRFSPEQVETALTTVPRQVVLGARDSRYKIVLTPNGQTRFMPSGTGVAVIDWETGKRRPSTALDVEQFVRLSHAMTELDIARPVVTATDFPSLKTDLVEFLTGLRHTTKHFHHRVLRPENVATVIAMAQAVAGSSAELRAEPLISVCFCPTSPLLMVPETAHSMLAFAANGIPVLVLSMAMGGATAPATILGEAILVNTEVIAGIALIQTLYPGCPVMYGSVSSVMDMSTAILALGAPERGVLNAVLADMANHYGIPCVMGGLSTDSKHVDVQSGFEKAMTAIPLLGRANVIFGPGVLNSGNTYSLEQLVIDADAIGGLRKLNNPIDALEGRRACDLIKTIGPGHHYLEADHTMAHFRAYWRPGLFNRELAFGSQDARNDIAGRAQACIREYLESPEQEILDRKTADELERMVKSALEDG